MLRTFATAGAVLPVAATALARDGSPLASTQPTVWSLLGYPVEAGPLIAGLCACFAVRFYVGLTAGQHRWVVDMPVSALTLMFTVGLIQHYRPEPIGALMMGTGLGAIGVGIITIAKRYLDQVLGPLAKGEGEKPAV